MDDESTFMCPQCYKTNKMQKDIDAGWIDDWMTVCLDCMYEEFDDIIVKRNTHKDYKVLKKQINLAFKELKRECFIARQDFNFDMCGGVNDIWEEIDNDRANGRTYKGYVFYHGQDAMFFKEDGAVCLAWGSADENAGEKENLKIGKAIVKILSRFDMEVEWDGSVRTRIAVSSKK